MRLVASWALLAVSGCSLDGATSSGFASAADTCAPIGVIAGAGDIAGDARHTRDECSGAVDDPGDCVIETDADACPAPSPCTTVVSEEASSEEAALPFAAQTARIVESALADADAVGVPAFAFTLGDHAYPDGEANDFARSYAPTWGRFAARTHPTVGNNDYGTERQDPTPYASYFEQNGAFPGLDGDSKQLYYDKRLGSWHFVWIDSECKTHHECEPGTRQYEWFERVLAKNADAPCTVVFMHRPPVSSAKGKSKARQSLWKLMYRYGVDAVLSGHVHVFESFSPLNDALDPDYQYGITPFIVGTGGGHKDSPYLSEDDRRATSRAYDVESYGALRLELHADRADWRFVTVDGRSERQGTLVCHGRPPAAAALP